MIRVTYNSQKQPPAPFVLVTLANPLSGNSIVNVPAQIDTAADRTLLPLALLYSLSLEPVDDLLIGGVGGTIERMPVFLVSIGVLNLPPKNLCVVAHPDEQWALLGRDVLNGIRIVLDGPKLTIEIE
ncbi:MAG: hypothetical protein K2X38_17380 [Gemmataceae bacterium]|nr:hypothetical protein [Gemmataceae bacterium]